MTGFESLELHRASPLLTLAVAIIAGVLLGEAAKRISQSYKDDHDDIPWRQMSGMRDILIHAYDHVDIDQVFDAVKVSVPELIDKIAPLCD